MNLGVGSFWIGVKKKKKEGGLEDLEFKKKNLGLCGVAWF